MKEYEPRIYIDPDDYSDDHKDVERINELEADNERLRAFVAIIARWKCDISLYGTLPDCAETYPDQQDTHWCVGCLARKLLKVKSG